MAAVPPGLQSRPYDPEVAFHELPADEAHAERGHIAAAALDKARLVAAQRLIDGPASGDDDAASIVSVLSARDTNDPRYERLSYFEKHWALLTLSLVAGVVVDPSPAVKDAFERGASVAELAAALGITDNGVYKRYAHIVVRRPRKRA
ncbi:hypothetical protein MSZK_60500 [Mycobacterium sp. shizuoka-1]|nr:hypothetical protein MSZK_60500 [Mycobacterium sp. shizuoka-1]